MEAVTNQDVDFCLPFKELKELVRISRSDELELTGNPIEFPEFEKPTAEAVSAILPVNFGDLLAQAASVVLNARTVTVAKSGVIRQGQIA